jgi:hypothetical protein
MTNPVSKGEGGFFFEWEDRTMGMMRSGSGEFRAPFLVNYDGNFKTKEERKFKLSALCIPIKPGWSRGIIITRRAGDGNDEKTTEKKKKQKKSLLAIAFSVLPVWAVHQLSNRFLDSDLAFLHFQEQERGRRADYFMPAPADRCISALRQWITTYTSLNVTQPLPPSLPRQVMFDRWSQHTSHCKHCQAGLKSLKKYRKSTYAALSLSVLGINFRLAKVSTLICLGILKMIHTLEKSFRDGEFKHYENN